MNLIKEGQHDLVEHILRSAACGPQNAGTIMNTKLTSTSISEAHVDFVIQQLFLAGALSQISDGRHITTSVGDDLLNSITQHVV
jgi:ribosomal protein S19E (S16A)